MVTGTIYTNMYATRVDFISWENTYENSGIKSCMQLLQLLVLNSYILYAFSHYKQFESGRYSQ